MTARVDAVVLERAARVLATHDPDVTSYDAGDLWGCRGCEWRADQDVPSEVRWDAFVGHQATMLAAAGLLVSVAP